MLSCCNLVEIESAQLKKDLGRVWDLGPVVVSKEPGSNSLSIIGLQSTFDHSMVSLSEFKQSIMSVGADNPLLLKFSVSADRGPYGMDGVRFNDQAVCRYVKTVFSPSKIELVFEMLATGKELNIFDGISGNEERSGDTKPLFWASLF